MLGRQASVGTPQASPAQCASCGRQSLKAAPRPIVAPSAPSSVFRKGDASFKVRTETTKLVEHARRGGEIKIHSAQV